MKGRKNIMNKKVIVLIALILIIAVVAIVVGINLAGNNESTNTLQNQASSEEQEENQEVGQAQNNENVLVVYFSHTGNTETVANFIHEAVGGDIVKLETEEQYTDNYNDLLDIAQEEQNENARPALSTKINNIEDYDTIFLGYPIWWGDMPMALYTFLDEYDLSGKTIEKEVYHGRIKQSKSRPSWFRNGRNRRI